MSSWLDSNVKHVVKDDWKKTKSVITINVQTGVDMPILIQKRVKREEIGIMQVTEKNSDPIKVVGTDRVGRRWPVCWLSLLLSLMTAVTAMAQLTSFTLDDLIPGGKTYEDRLPDRLSLVWWGNKLVKAEQGRA